MMDEWGQESTVQTKTDDTVIVSTEQDAVIKKVKRVMEIFKNSEAEIRPHFILTGPSGSGKSHTVQYMVQEFDMNFVEINAAQLTKEGTSGNSLSKALTPLLNSRGQLTVCFVDEFDKLFIAGNENNGGRAHDATMGVQNEFLKILESSTTQVFGDYGKYITAPTGKTLFVFAGAFNGEANLNLDRLRKFGIKTEFLGRVGLVFNLEKMGLDSMKAILRQSKTLKDYINLFPSADKEEVISSVMKYLADNYEQNTIGVRLINTLLHQYFITGGAGLNAEEVKAISFQTKMEL